MGGEDPRNRGEQAEDEREGIGRRVEIERFLPGIPMQAESDVERTKRWREHLSPDRFRVDRPGAVVSSVLRGYLRLGWILAVGLMVVFILDRIDPRRQVEYSRLLTETPLAVAFGVGVVGVAVRAVRSGPDWPSAGAFVRTTVLLTLMVALFTFIGPTGVV